MASVSISKRRVWYGKICLSQLLSETKVVRVVDDDNVVHATLVGELEVGDVVDIENYGPYPIVRIDVGAVSNHYL